MPNSLDVVQIDFLESIVVERSKFANEVRALQTLSSGLRLLSAQIKRREVAFAKAGGDQFKVVIYGAENEDEVHQLDVMACMFHWFGLSVCNYVRLVGFIRGLHMQEFVRDDLTDNKGAEKVKKSIKRYAVSVSELSDVSVWRNKVFAHFALTDPQQENIATLEMSIVFPVSFDGKYSVGDFTLTRSNSSGCHTSALPHWSMTEVFESLIPRYWPGLVFQERSDIHTQERSDDADTEASSSEDKR